MTTGGYLYTNRDDEWADFTLRGIEVSGGHARLAALPVFGGPAPADSPYAHRPGGLAITSDGTVFATDQPSSAVLRIDGCNAAATPVPCIGGTGTGPGRLDRPGALLVHPGRNALIVADTGNRRLQLFDLGSGQLLDIWPDIVADALAADPAGRVYTVDRDGGLIRRFSAGGREFTAFAARAGTLAEPVAIAVDHAGIRVLERGTATIVTLDTTGRPQSRLSLTMNGRALGLAVTPGSIHVGDNTAPGGRILRLAPDGTLIGAAIGYTGPVTALAADATGALWVHPGAGLPLRLTPDGHVREGVAWGGPFGGFTKTAKNWQRVSALAAPLPMDGHVRFFVAVTNNPAAPPPVGGTGPDAFADPAWHAGPEDLTQHLVERPPARYAWLGMRMTGSGHVSPDVEQVRLDFDKPGYLPLLPAVYGEDLPPTALLPRYLALVESLFGDVEREIGDLSRLDPAVAGAPFLAELARWTGAEAATRAEVAGAYAASADRGTSAGLRAALRRTTGMTVLIDEPVVRAAWWSLAPADAPEAERAASVLGVTTMLAAAQPQGAVLGSTAAVNSAQLIGTDEYGAPLFDAYAHRFTVRLYAGRDYSEEGRRAVVDFLDRERPADTEYQVCRIEPALRIGQQAVIGVDAVLGGDPLPTRLAAEGGLLRLGGRAAGRLDQHSRIGVDTVLGSSAIED